MFNRSLIYVTFFFALATAMASAKTCNLGTELSFDKNRQMVPGDKIFTTTKDSQVIMSERKAPGSSKIELVECTLPQGTEYVVGVSSFPWAKKCGNIFATVGWALPIIEPKKISAAPIVDPRFDGLAGEVDLLKKAQPTHLVTQANCPDTESLLSQAQGGDHRSKNINISVTCPDVKVEVAVLDKPQKLPKAPRPIIVVQGGEGYQEGYQQQCMGCYAPYAQPYYGGAGWYSPYGGFGGGGHRGGHSNPQPSPQPPPPGLDTGGAQVRTAGYQPYPR